MSIVHMHWGPDIEIERHIERHVRFVDLKCQCGEKLKIPSSRPKTHDARTTTHNQGPNANLPHTSGV